EDPDAEPLAPLARQPGQRVTGRQRQRQGDQDDQRADDQRVPEPCQVERLLEEKLQIRQGQVVVEDQRVVLEVVEVAIGLERRQQHPVERERQQRRERGDGGVEPDLLRDLTRASRLHAHATSARRAICSMTTATTTSTGNRKSEIAAPPARSPPRMPVKKARLDSTCVAWAGPPRVST